VNKFVNILLDPKLTQKGVKIHKVKNAKINITTKYFLNLIHDVAYACM